MNGSAGAWRGKKSKETNGNRRERRIIHVIILFTLVLLTFFIYIYTAF
jgi:hypothetical protein